MRLLQSIFVEAGRCQHLVVTKRWRPSSHSVARALCLLVVTFAMPGCSKPYDEAIWTEEVKLHDGRMIQVWRRVTQQPSGFPVAPRGRELEVELKYPALGVHWKYNEGLRQPLSFEIFDGVPHLVLHTRERAWCQGKSPDALPAQFLVWKEGSWHEIPETSYPVNKGRVNLYIRYQGHGPEDDAKGLITWQKKASRDDFRADAPYSVQAWHKRHGTCHLHQNI